MFDLLAVGMPSVDIVYSGLPHWPELGMDMETAGLGLCAGRCFSTPAAANRLGLRACFATLIGNDPWSRIVLEEFAAEGLPTDQLKVLDRSVPPQVSVALNFDGDRGFVSYTDDADEHRDIRRRHALDAVERVMSRHLHAQMDDVAPELVEAARRRGMSVSLDAMGGAWERSAPLTEILPPIDILLANESEALAITGAKDVRAALEALVDLSHYAVIKRGALGAIGCSAHGSIVEVSGEPAHAIDATGAGDCFNAGFLRGWLASMTLAESLAIANICAGKVVESFGGYRGCPREADLEVIAASRGIRVPSCRPDPPDTALL